MNFLEKLIRADDTRKTRFHTSNGQICLNLPNITMAGITTLQRHLGGRLAEIPWFAWSAYHFLKPRVAGQIIFEFSSGMSTLWFAKHCKMIYSVEDNRAWFETIAQKTKSLSNVSLVYADSKESYLSAIDPFEKESFDIISIDGSHRMDCFIKAYPYLKQGGMLIVDNTDADFTQPIVKAIPEYFSEDQILRFVGFPPGCLHATETTICLKN